VTVQPGSEEGISEQASASRLTWSNALTSLRLLASFPLYCAIVSGAPRAACAIFWAAVASDWLDGRIARARGEVTSFGGVLDHGSDATLVTLGLSALAMIGVGSWVLPLLVGLAFLQYAFDSRALAGRPLRASALGRWNGIFYFVPIGVFVTRESLGLDWPSDVTLEWLVWALVVSTAASMIDRGWALVRRSA